MSKKELVLPSSSYNRGHLMTVLITFGNILNCSLDIQLTFYLNILLMLEDHYYFVIKMAYDNRVFKLAMYIFSLMQFKLEIHMGNEMPE
jgi:hypothetical protein